MTIEHSVGYIPCLSVLLICWNITLIVKPVIELCFYLAVSELYFLSGCFLPVACSAGHVNIS